MKICRNKNHIQPCELYEKCPTCGAISCWKNWKDFRHSCKKRLKTLESRITKPCRRCENPMRGNNDFCRECRQVLDKLINDIRFLKDRGDLEFLHEL